MKDLLDPAAVEARLRRTLALRAEDMAPGDGIAGQSVSEGRSVSAVVAGPGPGRRPRRRRAATVVLAAAAVVVAAVGAVAALGLGDDGNRVVTRQQPDDTTDPTPTTSTTVLSPSMQTYGIARFTGPGYTVSVQFNAGGGEDQLAQNSFWEEVQAGSNRGYYARLPNGSISELRLIFADGTVSIMAGAAPREDLLAAGATVRLDPTTGMYTLTPLPGWTTEWVSTPEDLAAAAADQGTVAEPPVSLGRFVCPAAPVEKSFNATWYGGWTDASIPDDAKPVTVGNGEHPAYFGTIAPDAGDLFQLWIVYPDGVVELQAVAMTEADLVVAGGGVVRREGSDFEVTPPPCFTASG